MQEASKPLENLLRGRVPEALRKPFQHLMYDKIFFVPGAQPEPSDSGRWLQRARVQRDEEGDRAESEFSVFVNL